MRRKGTNELAGSGRAGSCPACERWMPDGPDVCIGLLPYVSHACCGHGDLTKAYVVIGGQPNQPVYDIPDAVKLTGIAAVEYMLALGR